MAIRVEKTGAVAWAAIDRPEVLNALDLEHLERLLSVLQQAGQDEETAVLVLTGVGRAFCAGADIKAMDRMTEGDFARLTGLFQALARTARGLDTPILGAINGLTIGGGFEVALMCDLRVAARSARFRLPDAELGFSPTSGLTYLLPRTVGFGRAMHLLLTCEEVDATEAERIGLVTEVVEDEALNDRIAALAERLAAYPRHAVGAIKSALVDAADMAFAECLDLEESSAAANRTDPTTQANLAAFARSRGKG